MDNDSMKNIPWDFPFYCCYLRKRRKIPWKTLSDLVSAYFLLFLLELEFNTGLCAWKGLCALPLEPCIQSSAYFVCLITTLLSHSILSFYNIYSKLDVCWLAWF
jgi:hypothetical protein